MSGPVSRKLFRYALLLYPKAFRDEFAAEMLDTFEECQPSQGLWRLLPDMLLSAARQQIYYRSTPVPQSAALFSEIRVSPKLARIITGATLGASLILGALTPERRDSQPAAMVDSETLYWFPIQPEARSCSGVPENAREPEGIFTTGVLVSGNGEDRQYATIVRGKTRFWISTVPWGRYCRSMAAVEEQRREKD